MKSGDIRNEIKESYVDKVTIDSSCPVGYEFGEEIRTKRNRNLSLCPVTPDPPELLELIQEMKTGAVEYLKKNGCKDYWVRDAYIKFIYESVSYKMYPDVLGLSDAEMEQAAPYILGKLRDMGADYGKYIGYLD